VINHTNGPWRVSFESRAIVAEYPSVVIAKIEGELADRIGNARAIAATPALIAACQAVLQSGAGSDDVRLQVRKALVTAGL
jgi:nitrate/nitrite transporter NarK